MAVRFVDEPLICELSLLFVHCRSRSWRALISVYLERSIPMTEGLKNVWYDATACFFPARIISYDISSERAQTMLLMRKTDAADTRRTHSTCLVGGALVACLDAARGDFQRQPYCVCVCVSWCFHSEMALLVESEVRFARFDWLEKMVLSFVYLRFHCLDHCCIQKSTTTPHPASQN